MRLRVCVWTCVCVRLDCAEDQTVRAIRGGEVSSDIGELHAISRAAAGVSVK